MRLAWLLFPLLVFIAAACDGLKPPSTPVRSSEAIRGRVVYDTYCSRCHGISGDTVIVGPSLAGIASRAGTRVDGMDAQEYILDSIMNPGAYTVDGFVEGLMPAELVDEIPEEDLKAVVAFLMTLE